MIAQAIQKNIDSSPRKLRLVADMLKKMTPDQAVEILKYTPRAGAEPMMKAIKTAIANAGSGERLAFKSIEINEGLKLKRYRVGTAGRGRGRPWRRRYSHIKIVLTDEIMEDTRDKKQVTKDVKGGAKTKGRAGDSVEQSPKAEEARPESA